MKCELCGKQFAWLADVPFAHPQCPECINDGYERDVARVRRKYIIQRCKAIEKELGLEGCNLAKLRLERSELDGELEALDERQS